MASPQNTSSVLVPAELAKATVSAVVKAVSGELTWRQAKELCQSGRVLVDGVLERDPARRVEAGQRIELLSRPAAAEPSLLIHFDPAIAVVNKPAGVLTVPVERTDRDTLIHRAAAAVRRAEAKRGVRGSPSLRAVQRLDRDTSGLLVFARTIPAQRALQAQLKARTVWRRYLALVEGRAADDTYATHLLEDRGDGLRGSWERRRGGAAAPPSEAKFAVTHVKVEELFAGASLVSCRLETGRQHQIRIHLSEAGHPLLGETIYVRDARRGVAGGPQIRAPRPLLHAAELGFEHPSSGEAMRFSVDPPADFQSVLTALRRP